ncbi:MAG: exonuclease [Paenibacillus sp.]|nr:exonuclease [Paenibacillus sp.]
MNYVVFDMEFTVLRKQQNLSDILEIGAVKLRDDCGQPVLIDMFHTYVQPHLHRSISPLTTEFTGITQQQVDNAPSFSEAARQFGDWLKDGGADTPYYLCSWGPDDKFQLLRHCTMHKISMDWVRNYNDIQLAHTRLKGGDHGQRWGLKRALDDAGLAFFGSPHNGLDDAYNTAKLFVKMYPEIKLEQNSADELMYSTTVVYSTSSEEDKDNPFKGLAEKLGFVI